MLVDSDHSALVNESQEIVSNRSTCFLPGTEKLVAVFVFKQLIFPHPKVSCVVAVLVGELITIKSEVKGIKLMIVKNRIELTFY